MAEYRYLLTDLLTGTRLAELPFETARYTDVLNGPGAFTGTMALRQPDLLTDVLTGTLTLGRASLYVERDGVIMWGGILWTDSAAVDAGTYTLNGEGWLSYFRRRILRSDKTYTGVEQVSIAKDLLDYAQAQPGGSLGIVTTDITATGVTRDRTYLAVERKWIGQSIEQLAAVDGGFDFRFESRWNSGTLQTRFLTSYPKTGRVLDLRFEVGKQVTAGTVQTDATALVSHVDAIGATPDPGTSPLLGSATDTGRLVDMPMLDDVVSFTDVSVAATLNGHAQTRLNRGKAPIKLPGITVTPTGDTGLGSYLVGDNVEVFIDEGLCRVDGRHRITERAVTIDNAGGEDVALSFANEEVFSA